MKEKTTFSQLEKELDFSNDSLVKSDGISAERLYRIAQHFNIPMKSIIEPNEGNERIAEKERLGKQNEKLLEMAKVQLAIVRHYKMIDKAIKDSIF